MRPQSDNAPTPRPIIQALSKQAASASTLDVSPHGTKLEVKTRQAQPAKEDPERIATTPAERRANFEKAVKVVDEMTAKGILWNPYPDYILSEVIYKDEVGRNEAGLIF